MAKIGRQSQLMSGDRVAAIGAGRQGLRRKRMAQRVRRGMAGPIGQPCLPRRNLERAIDIGYPERFSYNRHEYMGGQWRVLAPLLEISFQCCPRRLVQRHEAAFPELGPFNHQAIGRDVVYAQPNGFGDSSPVHASKANNVL